jgi:transglutaminase-like putative cysteine protease
VSAVPSIGAAGLAGARAIVPQWPGWSRLPRETRDTLFLLGVIAWTVLPHLSHLPAWAIALTTVVLVWRGTLALTNAALPGRWLLVGVLLTALGLAFWSYGTLLGREPGITMAVTLMALKTLELRARRDAFVVFFLGFFIILTHFLYSQSFMVALAMLVSVWGLLTALVLAHMPVGQPSLRQAASLAARTAALGAPIMALLFVLFPRIGPLWGVPQDGISRTGLSNTMKLGSVAQVANDDSIAMRLRFEGARPAPPDLYFRGPVLTRFDGVEWRPLGLPFAPAGLAPRPPNLKVSGTPVRYEVTLEPLRLASVPLLEATTEIQGLEGMQLSARDDLQWLAERPIVERIRLDAVASTRFVLGAPKRVAELQESLQLPSGYNLRTLAWARALREQPRLRDAGHAVLAEAVLRHIRSDGYSYTLSPGEYGRDSIDEFWLDRKEGFCEHFAASFVVVMRAMGVPARIVTGYQGVDLSPVDGYTVVRQSSAHAWAEYWQPATGWVRADPTAAVAPDRIGRSTRLAPQLGFVAGSIHTMSPQLMEQMRNAWEAVNNRWNQWVLQYTRGQQLQVLKNIGFEAPTWEDLALMLVTVLSGVALAGAAWAWYDRHRVDPWVRQLDTLRRTLQSLGLEAAAHEAPRTLAARVRDRLGDSGEPLGRLLDELEAQRYGRSSARRPDASLTRRFVAEARHLKAAAA